MNLITSISPIDKLLRTGGSKPVIVWGDDLNYYVTKYGKPHDLFNEVIGAEFARIWEIPIPDSVLIQVKPNHIPEGMAKILFEKPCFGSFYIEYASDVNEISSTWISPYEQSKIANKTDLLKIALFDIWLCNEDRNHNNANLLLNPTAEGYIFTAIDHVNIFNSNSLENGIYQITEDESIINSSITSSLIRRSSSLVTGVNDLIKKFYLYAEECLDRLPEILNTIPKEWAIDINQKYDLLLKQLGNSEWIKETEQSFRFYLENQLLKA